MDERLARLAQTIRELNAAGIRRTVLYDLVGESLRATIGEPPPLRRAKAFAHLLDRVEQVVLPYELLAGSIVGMWPLAEGLPGYARRREEAIAAIRRYLQTRAQEGDGRRRARFALMARDHYHANIDYADLQRLNREMIEFFADADIAPNEIAGELERHFNFDYGEEVRTLLRELPWTAANHLDLNYGKAVRLGLGAIREEIGSLRAAAGDPQQRLFYDAAAIAADAAIRFILRYAGTLESAAATAAPDRAAELTEMARICRRIATAPPETFRQALQLVWMLHTIGNLDDGSALSFARFDQYMYPFYRRDLDSGRLTRSLAKTLIGCLWLKVNEPHMRTVQSICLAGTTPDGEPAANDLTRLCLEVCRELRVPYPNTAVRVRRDTPDEVWDEVVATICQGCGQPMLLNDEVWIPNLVSRGYDVKDARDYYNMGCVEIMIQGRMALFGAGGGVSLPELLERLLHDGAFDDCADFDSLLETYLAAVAAKACEAASHDAAPLPPGACDPFASLLIDGCLERGRDLYHGGARLPAVHAIGATGLGTAVDSLSAIRTFVFEQKRLTLPELREMLERNFAGDEHWRRLLLHQTPCFGNDIDDVDEIARRICDTFCEAVHAQRSNDGGPYVTMFFSYTSHVAAGEVIGATPNGRRAGQPISNGVGPSQGADRGGPTRLLNSITKLDPAGPTGAFALNMKFSPVLLNEPEGAAALKGLLKAYFASGGVQVQINVVDRETLLAALDCPEEHQDLIVRVGGFCEYFVRLDRQLQEEVVQRTLHEI